MTGFDASMASASPSQAPKPSGKSGRQRLLACLALAATVHVSDGAPTFATVGDVRDWSLRRLDEASAEFTQQGFKRLESPDSWGGEVVYNVFVDRFANGDIRNDLKNVEQSQKDGLSLGNPELVHSWRHGGDLQGVRNRLGYLRDLGVTVIWLSPIFECNRGRYDGYLPSDPTKIDPGFGSDKLFRQLVHEAHQHGIRVLLDIVVNHMAATGLRYWGAPSTEDVSACTEAAEIDYWKHGRNETFEGRAGLIWGTVPEYMRFESFYVRCGSKNNMKDPGVLNDPRGNSAAVNQKFEAYELWPEFFQDDFFEFNTMDPTFTEVFSNLMNYWIAYADIDGFRVDAVAHISADFSAYLSTHARHFAASLGKNNFYLMGEVLLPQAYPELYVGRVDIPTHRPKKLAEVLRELEPLYADLAEPSAGMTSMYPSPDSSAYIRDVATGKNPASEWFNNAGWIRGREWFEGILDRQADLKNTWAMVENHDQNRLLALQGGSIGWDQWRLLAALGWSFTSYAMPALYYGVELAFNGQCLTGPDGNPGSNPVFGDDISPGSTAGLQILERCNYSAHEDSVDDGFKRQDMFEGGPLLLGSAVAAVQSKARISGRMMEAWGPHWCEEGLLDRGNPVYRTVKALGRIRRSCPALRARSTLNANGSHSEQLAYWKVADGAPSYSSPRVLLVLLTFSASPSWSSSRFAVPSEFGFAPGDTLVDLLRPDRKVTIGADGFLDIMEPSEAAQVSIFAPESATVADAGAHWLLCAGHDLPELPVAAECRDPGHQWGTWAVLGGWTLLVVGLLLKNARSYIYLCLVNKPSAPETPVNPICLPPEVQEAWPHHVFVAAIEHTIPERGVKVSAGGLGKVLDQMLKEHPPGRLSLVHPKVGGVNYGETDYFTKISVVVDGQTQDVEIHTIESTYEDIVRTFFILDHPWFSALTKEAPYPYPMTKLSVLRFFSLWNQASAALMVLLRPDVYHCMDYHAAMVPLYVPMEKQIPTIIVLHNADYDGAVETDFINDVAWRSVAAHRRLSLIFNLEMASIRKYVTFEGRFNMLWAGIASLKETQKGYGVCTVSGKYADELKRERTMFQGLPTVMPIDNAIDGATDAPKSIEELQLARAMGKRRLQEFCGLDIDPDAKILIFLGRWVKQKGVDHIALLAPRILQAHPDVQFVLAGPAGDPYGSYAQEMLLPLTAEFSGRIFMATTFFSIPKEVRAGAHFCLMPSVSEPFGYVDVEFGLLGVPSLGCAIGGLGKMPGVYFRQQNSDSSEMLLAGFYAAMDHALSMPDADYWAMAHAGMGAEFPFSVWRENLHECYRAALTHFPRDLKQLGMTALDSKVSFEVLEEQRRRPWKLPVMSGSKVLNQIQRMDVTDAGEFLTQPVSEERVREIMHDWMAGNKVTDAETLQSHISLAAQRLKEKNCITQWLMRPSSLVSWLLGSRCLRIHVFIALGYILSPPTRITLEVEKLHWSQNKGGGATSEIGFNFTLISWLLQGLGLAVGSLLWLYLSGQVPANLLMSASLFLNLIYYFAVQTLVGTNDFWIQACNFCGGVLGSARLLFLVWNFNEDFKGGFQVAAKRVALVETARSVIAYSMQALTTLMVGGALLQSWIYILSSFCLGFMVALAPSCYSTYVLPSTNFFKDLLQHKVYLLLTVSLSLDALCSYSSQQSVLWLKLDGWMVNEVGAILLCIAAALLVLLVVVFTSLHKMSVWGPWAMRDFTCLVPPGSIMRAIAFDNLGYQHFRSWVFVAALVLSVAVDVARYSAMWTAILSTLANKWYALKGGFLAVTVISTCSAVSPFVVHWAGKAFCGISPVYDSYQEEYPQLERLSLETATVWTVLPFACAAYVLQLLAARYFTFEVLTYKGHGHVMPGGRSGGEGFSSLPVGSRGIVRKMRQGAVTASLDKARSVEALV